MAPSGKDSWVHIMQTSSTIVEMVGRLRDRMYPREKMQDPIKKVNLNRSDGPMLFLGDVIVKKMEKAGYPSMIIDGYRSPEKQQKLFDKRPKVTYARPWQSAHQFFEAVCIVHKSKYWNASPEYWETLANVVRTVSREYNVDLTHGHYWRMVDSAHIELTSWRDVQKRNKRNGGYHKPTPEELRERFFEILPQHVSP